MSERLRVPGWWWLLAMLGIVVIFVAYDVALGRTAAVATAVLLSVACVVWLAGQGSTTVSAGGTGLTAGRAHLPSQHIGTVEALDTAAMATARSRNADPRAFYLLKGYVPTGVRVWVDDSSDPVPYWLVSTRQPRVLASSLADARDAARSSA